MLQEEPKTESTPELPLEQTGPTAPQHKPKKSKKKHRCNDTGSERQTVASTGPKVRKVPKKKAAKKGPTVKVMKKRVIKKTGRLTANLKTEMKFQYDSDDELSSYSSDSGTSCGDSHSTDCSTCSSCSCTSSTSSSSSSSSSSPEPRRQQKIASQKRSRQQKKSTYRY